MEESPVVAKSTLRVVTALEVLLMLIGNCRVIPRKFPSLLSFICLFTYTFLLLLMKILQS